MQKIKVGILGATGSVGQKFIELLENHPWFEISSVAASDRSSLRPYREAVNWFMQTPIPPSIAQMPVDRCEPGLDCKMIFSGLDSSVAGEIETKFAQAVYIVISNSKNHRFDSDVPLLIPEVNSDHLLILKHQKYGKGMIVTNPNCSTIGLIIALKPLIDKFGIETVNVVTMQAPSGAGYPGVPGLDCVDNVLSFIQGEEKKIETEPLKILGNYENGSIKNIDLKISTQCNRVPVLDGHLEGMAVSIGRLRECNIFDFKFVLLSHNTIRGAAGGTILNAELMKVKNYL